MVDVPEDQKILGGSGPLGQEDDCNTYRILGNALLVPWDAIPKQNI